jgi:quercetin dioxygenase-like cupin family protein
MGDEHRYHVVDPADLEQWDDRDVDVRSISAAVGLDYQDAPLGLRTYEAAPGQMLPLTYHYHDEQVEAFFVLLGTLHVETPEGEYTVGEGRAFVVHPGNPHRAYNPEGASEPVRVLAIGAPSVDDAHPYEPDSDGAEGEGESNGSDGSDPDAH